MIFRDLFEYPIWEGKDLGLPIPESNHAVSVALPRWSDVIGYEEKKPEVVNRLKSGYPRFVIHKLVRDLARDLGGGKPCLPFPSLRVAEKCADFIVRTTGERSSVVSRRDLHGVTTTANGEAAMRAFWMHTGLIISTRQAQARLTGEFDIANAEAVRRSLRTQLAALYDCEENDVFLTPSGMAAQFAALEGLIERAPGLPTAQLGFPYVDTFKLQQKFGHGGFLFHNLATLNKDLISLLNHQPLAGAFCEIPGNPQLGSADLRVVVPILRQRGVPIVIDDVVATPYNVDLSKHADLIATSLTKYIAGTGDVMGGALICNPRSPFYLQIKPIIRARHEELLWGEDALIIDKNARDFPSRMSTHNANGLFIAERLREHPAIERVWYPKWEFSEIYESVRRPAGGYGSLVTFLAKDAARTSPIIFDNLEVCKGPSLGTKFTLACPFTMLAHYPELDWAESCGVSRHLIRISVGLEPAHQTWARIERALDKVK